MRRAISLAGCAALLDDVEGFAISTYDALAVLAGARRGIPRPLTNELARIFASTWGRWSAMERGKRLRARKTGDGGSRERRTTAAAIATATTTRRRRTRGCGDGALDRSRTTEVADCGAAATGNGPARTRTKLMSTGKKEWTPPRADGIAARVVGGTSGDGGSPYRAAPSV